MISFWEKDDSFHSFCFRETNANHVEVQINAGWVGGGGALIRERSVCLCREKNLLSGSSRAERRQKDKKASKPPRSQICCSLFSRVELTQIRRRRGTTRLSFLDNKTFI